MADLASCSTNFRCVPALRPLACVCVCVCVCMRGFNAGIREQLCGAAAAQCWSIRNDLPRTGYSSPPAPIPCQILGVDKMHLDRIQSQLTSALGEDSGKKYRVLQQAIEQLVRDKSYEFSPVLVMLLA